MTSKDNTRIKITIAGESLLLTVPFNRQDAVRDTEREVNGLFDLWRRRFTEKSDMELLAMIAFQYASHYSDLLSAMDEARSATEEVRRLLASVNPDGHADTAPGHGPSASQTETTDMTDIFHESGSAALHME